MTATARHLGRRPAKPASFPPNPYRRAMIAKIKIAQKELRISDDDYRDILEQLTGKRSSAQLNDAQLHAVIEHFKSKGFKPTTAASMPSRARPQLADHPAARKARALWISLGQLGAIDDPGEAALEAFGRRQLKVERLQWANGADMFKLIEALKAIATRHGWDQDVAGIDPARAVFTLKWRLAEALRLRLVAAKRVPGDWSLERLVDNDGVWAGGATIGEWSIDGLDRVVAHLAQQLQAAR